MGRTEVPYSVIRTRGFGYAKIAGSAVDRSLRGKLNLCVMNPQNTFPKIPGLSPLPRDEWMRASQFHALSQGAVLQEVSKRVKEAVAQAGDRHRARPLVLLDLDSTLYEVGPRTHQILREWLETDESRTFPDVWKELQRLESLHVGYSLVDTFAAIGLSVEHPEVRAAWEKAKRFWAARFFTSDYLRYDNPYPGAAEFCRELHERGAELVYLTGRDEPNMGDGTRENLARDGFPWSAPRTHLLMKDRFHTDDLVHKQSAADYVRNRGTLIASLENEPVNLVAIYELFPQAMHVFMETVSSDRPAAPCRGLYRIRGFLPE